MSHHRHRLFQNVPIFVFTFLGLLLLAGCTAGSISKPTLNLLTPAVLPTDALVNQIPPAAPSVAHGAQIYALKCQACHGVDGRGDGPRSSDVAAQGGVVADLVGSQLAIQANPSDWFNVVSNGRIDKLMPGFAQSLSPQDRWDVLSYVWAMGVQSNTLETTRSLYSTSCQSCHGPAGKGDGPQVASASIGDLSDPKYLASHSLQDVADAMATGAPHGQIKLDNQQRLDLASYVRTFGYKYTDTTVLAQTAINGNGMLSIQTENKTPNGPAISGLPVTLHTYDTTGEVFSRTATLDSHGIAIFNDLPVSSSLFYQADLVYKGARFFAAPAQFSDTQSLSTTLPVYEVTTDPSVMSISEFHYFVQGVGEGGINVVEFYVFDNSSDRAFISQPGPDGQLRTLHVTLPTDATNLKFDGPGLGARFFKDGQIVYDSDAVPPGQHASTIAMIYDVPYAGGRQIQRVMPYAVSSWDVILPDDELRITDMTDKGLQATQSGSVRYYVPNQPSVGAGTTLSFNLTGQPRGVPIPGTDNSALALGGIALLCAAAGSVILITRMRTWRTVERDVARERRTLLWQIASLDQQHSAGTLSETEYRDRRQALKNELRDIWE